jgi:hypothetical protein
MLEISRKKEAAIETSSLMTYNIGKHNKLFFRHWICETVYGPFS